MIVLNLHVCVTARFYETTWVHGLWNKLPRFRVLITWALERQKSASPLGPQQSLLKNYLRIHEFYDVFLA